MKNAFTYLCLLLLPFIGIGQTEVEPNNTISTANSIDYFSSSISGTIGVSGDDDYYEMIAESSGVVKINLDNVPNNIRARLRIYDSSGALIFSRTAATTGVSIETQLLVENNEAYYILVESTTSEFSAEPYTLSVNYDGVDLCEYNQTQGDACAISVNTSFEAKILGYTYGNDLDLDYYEISPTESGVVKIDLTNVPSELDLQMDIFGESGGLIFRRVTTTLGASISGQLLVEGGMKYYIEVSDRNDNGFSCDPYTMTLAFDGTDECEYNQTQGDACAIPLNTSFEAKILGYTWGDDLDLDYYEISPIESGVVKIDLTNVPSELDLQMDVFGQSGGLIFRRVTTTLGAPLSGQLLVEGGMKYYIEVRDRVDNAFSCDPYTMTLAFDVTDKCEYNQTQGDACFIPLDTTFESKILGYTWGDDLDVDYYGISPAESGVVKIDLTEVPSELDLQMDVFDESGGLIFRRVTTTLGASVSGQLLVEGGMNYFIAVSDRGTNAFSCDPYTMTVVFDDTDGCENNQAQGEACFISMDTTFESKILGYTWGDELDIDYYGISPEENGVVKIDLTEVPSELDMQIDIFDESGGLIFRRSTTTLGASLSAQLLVEGGQDYFVAVSDRNDDAFSCDPFNMTLSFDGTDACEYNQAQGDACFVSVDTTFESKILGNTYGNELDIDYYGISPDENGVVKIDLTEVPSELDLQMDIFDEAGSLIFRRTSITLGAPLSAQLLVEGGLNYFIAVSDRNDDAFSCDPYTMTLIFDGSGCEWNESFAEACDISPDTILLAKVLGNTYGDVFDKDFYKVTIPSTQSGLLDIQLDSIPADLRPRVVIYDENTNQVERKDANVAGAPLSFELMVSGGEVYYLEILGLGDDKSSCDPYRLKVLFDIMDAVEEQEIDLVQISPNPVSEMLNLSGLMEAQINQLEIYDAQGKRVWQRQIDSNEEQINMWDYSPGIYVLLFHNGQRTLSKKIIKSQN